MSFSSAIQPEINLFYGHYGLGTRTQQSFREIEWAMESNLLKCETHEMICVAETPESIVTLRAPSSGYGFTNATRGSPSERGHGRENTFRTIDIVQEKTTLREGSSWRTVRERERERTMPKVGAECLPSARSGTSPGLARRVCLSYLLCGRTEHPAEHHWASPRGGVSGGGTQAERNVAPWPTFLPRPVEPEILVIQVSWQWACLRSV